MSHRWLTATAIALAVATPLHAAATPPLATIPFELHGNLIIMQIKAEQLPTLVMVFDTGSSNTVIDASAAHRLDLEVEERAVQSQGAGGLGKSWLMLEPLTFVAGETQIYAEGVSVIDLADLSTRVGRRLDGIIGGDAFNNHVVRIDYVAQELELLPPSAAPPASEGLPIDFRFGIPTMDVEVSGLDGRVRTGRFFIDTGASRSAVLGARFTKQLGLPEHAAPRIPLTSRGAYRSFPTEVTRIGKLELGPFEFARPVVLLSEAQSGILADRKTAGVIGGGTLRRFTVTIDTRERRIHLKPNRMFDRPDDFDASGVQLQAEGLDFATVVVRGVIPRSPAAEQGVREGDRIVSLDGRGMDDSGLEWLREALRKAGTQVTLGIERAGERHDVTLELRRLL